jgi:hypothetical protein
MPRYQMTLEEMHAKIAEISAFAQQDSFTDADFLKISELYWLGRRDHLPPIDELDTPETIRSGVEKDGTRWAIGDGYMRCRLKYLDAFAPLYAKMKQLGKYEYYIWFTFSSWHPRPEPETEPHTHYGCKFDTKVSCCLCGFTKFANSYGDTRGGGLQASFFHRTDKFCPEECRCAEYARERKLWHSLSKQSSSHVTPGRSYASVAAKNVEQDDEDEESDRVCCFRTCGGAVGDEMSGGSRSSYVMVHCCKKCKCFEKQKKGDTRMLSGWYGSSYDDSDYQFIGSDEKFIDDGIVCDWCINDMIYHDELVYLTGS